jgi:hypothetical protein
MFLTSGEAFAIGTHTIPQQSFANRDTWSSGETGLRPILNNPAGLLKEEINLLPSPLFGGHGWPRPASSGSAMRLVAIGTGDLEGAIASGYPIKSNRICPINSRRKYWRKADAKKGRTKCRLSPTEV